MTYRIYIKFDTYLGPHGTAVEHSHRMVFETFEQAVVTGKMLLGDRRFWVISEDPYDRHKNPVFVNDVVDEDKPWATS